MDQIPGSMSNMQINSNSPPETPPRDVSIEDVIGLTGGKRKKSKTKKPQKLSLATGEIEITHSAGVPQTFPPTEQKYVDPFKDPVPSTSQGSQDKKRKDAMQEEEELGLGLGTSKSQRRKKKKSSKAEAQTPKPGCSVRQPTQQHSEELCLRPVHGPEAWLRPQRDEYVTRSPSFPLGQPSDESRAMTSSHSWQGSWESQTVEGPKWHHSSNPPQHRFELQRESEHKPMPEPIAGPSNLHTYKQKHEEISTSKSEQILGQIQQGKKRTVSGSSQSTCLFQIPDRVYGRPVHYKTIKLVVNYLNMDIKPIKIYRYDVSIIPEKPKKFLPKAYRQVVQKYFCKIPIGFDQTKNLYSLSYLPGVALDSRKSYSTIVTDTEGVEMKFEVSVKFTGVIDLTTIESYMQNGTSLHPPTEAIQAIDVILQQGTLESYIRVGRQFFKQPRMLVDLGDGQEMWNGLFQSAIFTNRPYINIDVVHKGFPKHQRLIDTFVKDFRLDTSRDINHQYGRDREAFLNFIKNLKVEVYIGGDAHQGQKREFICNGLVEPARIKKFTMRDGSQEKEMTVADYFEKVKGCRVRYPDLNCMWVGPRNKAIYYPMEFLVVSKGQVSSKQLNEAQISKIIKTSATTPLYRKKKIEEIIGDMNYSRNVFFKKFGLDIANEFLSVPAKILEPPKIDLGGTSVETKNGTWTAKKVLKAQALDRWAFIAIESKCDKYDNFISKIVDIGSNMGLRTSRPVLKGLDVKMKDVLMYFQRARDLKLSMVVVVLTSRGRDYYQRVKRAAERDVGVLTQCVMEHTITVKMSDAMVRNIILKINAKLMGINHALDSRSLPLCVRDGKAMIVGADVTHPAADQNSMPSIACVTASMDNRYCVYNIALSVQASKKEVIMDFEDLMLEHLTEYEERHRALPTKIFVFRDGVSDGQFSQVMNSELQAVYNAYARKTGPNGKRPEVLFLLVQKRHHTRFFLGDSSFNVSSGTVVDTNIVHPRELDFFLMSHSTAKGTARPTRYHVVCNGGKVPQDEVEQLTYYLCHVSARCTQAVSYPTPTYYAHLACMRARSLIYSDNFSMADLQKKPQRLRVLERLRQESLMFYI